MSVVCEPNAMGSSPPDPELEFRSLRARLGWVFTWTLLWALHLVLLFQFVPPTVLFSERPLNEIDYSLHYYQVDRANEAFGQSGRLWGWDPQQLAGNPVGTVEDMSSKTLELFVIALTRLGVAQGLAFNLYILLLHLLLPLLAIWAACLFRLSRGATFALTLLWVLLWYFDSFLHWCWYCGMISWVFISAFSVVAVGLVYRVFEGGNDPAGRGRVSAVVQWAAAGLGCAIIGIFHPLAVVVVAVPSAALYLRVLRAPGFRQHLFVLWCSLWVVVAASVWLLPALPIWRYVVSSEFFLRPGISFLFADFFELHLSASATGPPVQTGLRFLVLAGALMAFWRWRREGDRRALPLMVLVLGGVLLAYAGRYLWLTSTMQPYRFIAPAIFAAAVPSAVLLAEVLRWRSLRALSPVAATTLLLVALLLTPRVVRTVLFFFPSIFPFMLFEGRLPAPRHPVNTVLGARSMKMENKVRPAAFRQLRSWLQANHQGRGRVLVEDYEVGEYLAATTDLPIVGGFAYRPLHHGDANLFQYEGKLSDSSAELKAYFERYAIGFVVMRKVSWGFENKKDLLLFRGAFGGISHRVFETRIEPNYVMRGGGKVVSQQLNRIVVEGAKGADVVLRFHWLDSLRCKPGCTAERFAIEGNRVGFIRVKNPSARFEIYNSYEFR
ncbi:MAG: hypothetical protein JRH20_19260 [Deltaproteobacteria bacterium]|nr:hypothetical protein [Deltaproteobacteria bacterium]